MRHSFAVISFAALILTACAPTAPITGSLPFFGEGYRFEGDACRRIGESPATQEYLDDAADLVGCPEDLENLGVFVIDYSAQEVARQDGFVLYSVPRR
jgi:hypothetical protein